MAKKVKIRKHGQQFNIDYVICPKPCRESNIDDDSIFHPCPHSSLHEYNLGCRIACNGDLICVPHEFINTEDFEI